MVVRSYPEGQWYKQYTRHNLTEHHREARKWKHEVSGRMSDRVQTLRLDIVRSIPAPATTGRLIYPTSGCHKKKWTVIDVHDRDDRCLWSALRSTLLPAARNRPKSRQISNQRRSRLHRVRHSHAYFPVSEDKFLYTKGQGRCKPTPAKQG